ncbi:unnamed protein product [Taenia asiatica]|uniref:DUF1016_N domain-containing protein n=1 Tax=Taenia asiatica TaxID=60517 RepID=A0A0R3W1V6_TAEAS|nr:unnamed protein product [Taenia asiatica]
MLNSKQNPNSGRREANVYRVMLTIVESARPRSRGKQEHAHWSLQAKMLLDYGDQSVRALSMAHFLSHFRAFEQNVRSMVRFYTDPSLYKDSLFVELFW